MNKAERYRLYWQGKSPTVRKAVEDFLGTAQTPKEVAAKYHVSIVSVMNHAKILEYLYHSGAIDLPKILSEVKENALEANA